MRTTNLQNGSTGDEVAQLQDGLRRLGYQVEVDGRFGPRTEEAVKSLQMLFGYTVDGIAGEGTQRLVQQQLGYGWNLNLPNAKELAMRSQGGSPAQGKPRPSGEFGGDRGAKGEHDSMRGGEYGSTTKSASMVGQTKGPTPGIPSYPSYGNGPAKAGTAKGESNDYTQGPPTESKKGVPPQKGEGAPPRDRNANVKKH